MQCRCAEEMRAEGEQKENKQMPAMGHIEAMWGISRWAKEEGGSLFHSPPTLPHST